MLLSKKKQTRLRRRCGGISQEVCPTSTEANKSRCTAIALQRSMRRLKSIHYNSDSSGAVRNQREKHDERAHRITWTNLACGFDWKKRGRADTKSRRPEVGSFGRG